MAAATDYFKEVGLPGSATTLASPGFTIGNTTINVGSTANWPTTTGVTFAIDTGNIVVVNGQNTFVRTPGSYTEYSGVVSSGTTITGLQIEYGTAQNYPAGATTRVYIPVSSSRENKIVQGISNFANQNATLKTSAVTTAIGTLGISSSMLADSSVTAAKIDWTSVNARHYLARTVLDTTASQGATTTQTGWNGLGNIAFTAPSGSRIRVNIHEPVINGYSGSGAICIYGWSSSAVTGGTQVGMVGAAGISGAGIDGCIEFTTSINGAQYVRFLYNCFGISGTLNIQRQTDLPAIYSVEMVA